MNESNTVEKMVSQIGHLPNALISSFLNMPLKDVAEHKKSIAVNAMDRLNERLNNYSK